MSIYLLISIGLKGGAVIAQSVSGDLIVPALGTLFLGNSLRRFYEFVGRHFRDSSNSHWSSLGERSQFRSVFWPPLPRGFSEQEHFFTFGWIVCGRMSRIR